MPVPTWLSVVGHFASDVLGGIVGARLGGDWREKATEQATAELKRILLPDREDVMKELLYLGDAAASLVALLRKANQTGFVTAAAGKRYSENWIVNMLLKIEPQDREWVYTILNAICEQDEEEFFSHLEILHNDGFVKLLERLRADLFKRGSAIATAMETKATELNHKLLRTRVRLYAQAGRKGWRSWVDY